MKTSIHPTISLRKSVLILFLVFCFSTSVTAQCALDIYIANDQSGSVDARENLQSRQFIEQLSLSFQLGNSNTQSRIAIASWSGSNEFQQYNFPSAGAGYTTQLGDIVDYRNSPKAFNGNTDPYLALTQAWQNINITPVAGRNVPKVIVLMTDAFAGQVNPAIATLADQIKSTGIRIVVMGIDAAAGNPPQNILQNVASPGLNFSAIDYARLISDATATIQTINSGICPAPLITFDLTVAINNFDCNSGQVNYTVNNYGNQTFGPGTLSVSFYAGDPATSSGQLISTHQQNGIIIPANSSSNYNYLNSSMSGLSNLYAVVNLNTAGSNAQPPVPRNLSGRLLVTGENNALNNFSSPVSPAGCAKAIIQISNNGVMGCNNQANYQVRVSNTGSASANIQSMSPLAPIGFALRYGQVSNTPTGCSGLALRTQRVWASYFGGSSDDYIYDMAVDGSGNIYIAGKTGTSTGIATPGTFDNTYNGGIDGFVAKFNAAGVRQWSTYLGGSGTDIAYSLALDLTGNVYIAGYTTSTTGIASAGAVQSSLAGPEDAFLIKLNGSNGTRLWGTYYGDPGINANEIFGTVAVSGTTDVYLAMKTSTGSNNLTTNGTTHVGGVDIVLIKFNAATGARSWATIFGAAGDEDMHFTGMGDMGGDLVANSTSVFWGGATTSSSGIATGNYWDNTYAGAQSGVLARFNPADGSLYWSTYIDPAGFLTNAVESITFESQNSILIGEYGRITRFQDSGGVPSLSVLINHPNSITVDAAGNVYAIGSTAGTPVITPNAYQSVRSTGTEIYFSVYNSSLIQQYGSYYGDVSNEVPCKGGGVAIDPSGNLVFAGYSSSNPSTILGTPGAFQTSSSGGFDGIIAKFSPFAYTGTLPPGCSIELDYVYDASLAGNGAYQFSFGVTANKAIPTDDDPIIQPDNNFTVPGYSGTYSGFNGAVHVSDDVIKTGSPCVQGASPVTTALSFGGASACSGSFGTATITINNPNTDISFTNVTLQLILGGPGSAFSGEPYAITNGLQLQSPDISDPAYPFPGISGQLNSRNGTQKLIIYSLPPGISTFSIDVVLGTTTSNLSASVLNLPTFYNPGGSTNVATGTGYPAPSGMPAINLFCPGSIDAASVITMSATTTEASLVQWASYTSGNLSNTGTIASPSVIYIPSAIDIAAGYVDISLSAVSTGGCDNIATCRVLISNVVRDFGDAPASFDLYNIYAPVAAGSTKLTGFYLGANAPDTEPAEQPTINCDGDGMEEDGLGNYLAPEPGESNWKPQVKITNNSGRQGYLVAYVDWNNDGDFLDTGEQSTDITIPPSSGTAIYTPAFAVPTVGASMLYMRLRLSTELASIKTPYGVSPEGEVEDHILAMALLPLDIIDFTAKKNNDQVLLKWEMLNESFRGYFQLERSAGGISGWQNIYTINVSESNVQQRMFNYIDYHPYKNRTYYRLKQVNADGKYKYSPVRTVNFESISPVTFYPNPVKNKLYIRSENYQEQFAVSLTNISGRKVLHFEKMINGAAIPLTGLPAGIYILTLMREGNMPAYYKIVKQ